MNMTKNDGMPLSSFVFKLYSDAPIVFYIVISTSSGPAWTDLALHLW